MEALKEIMKKPVIGGVTVGIVAATIAAYMIYKRDA